MVISETIGQEVSVLGIAVLVGAGLFLFYDIVRIFRRIIPHGVIWVGVEDVVYWLICTGVVFVMLYHENDGMVRGFALGGIVFGMLLYYLVFSRLMIRINVTIWKAVSGFLGRVFLLLFGPLIKSGKKGWGLLIKQLKKIVRAVKIGLCKL